MRVKYEGLHSGRGEAGCCPNTMGLQRGYAAQRQEGYDLTGTQKGNKTTDDPIRWLFYRPVCDSGVWGEGSQLKRGAGVYS